MGNIERAMLMLCSSVRGALTLIFVRAVVDVATFLLLLSCPAQSVPTVRLVVGPIRGSIACLGVDRPPDWPKTIRPLSYCWHAGHDNTISHNTISHNPIAIITPSAMISLTTLISLITKE
jgi:hypothetical protein